MLSLRESQALITQACGLVNGDDRPSVSVLPSQSGTPLNLRAAAVSAAPLSGGNTPRTPRTPRTPHTPIVEKDTFTPVWKRGTVSSFPVTPRHAVTDDAAVRSSEVHVHPQPAMNSHHSATHQTALTTQTDRAHRTDGLTNIEAVARELPEPETTYEDKCLDAGAGVVLERFTGLCYDLAQVNLSRAMSRKSLDLDADDLLRAIYILEKENELRSMKLQAVDEELAALEEHKLEVVTESFKQQGVGGNSSGLSDVGYPSSSKPIGGVGGLRGLGGPQSKSSQGLAAAVFGLQPSQSGGGFDRGDQSPSEPGSLSQAQKRPAIPGVPLTHQTYASAFSTTGGTGAMEGHQFQNQPAGQMNQMNNGSFGGGHPSLQRGQSGVAPSSSSFAGPSQSLGRETSLTLGSAAGGAAGGGAFDSLSQGGGGGGGGGFAPASGFVMSGNSQATPSSKDTKQSHHAHQHDPGRLRRGDGGGDLIVGGLTAGGRHANATDANDSSRHQAGGRGYMQGGGGDARLHHQASSSHPHHHSMLDGSRAGRGVSDHASMRGHRAQFSSGHYDPNTNANAGPGTRLGLGGKGKPPVPIVQYAVGRSTASASAHGNPSKAFDEKWARQAARMHA